MGIREETVRMETAIDPQHAHPDPTDTAACVTAARLVLDDYLPYQFAVLSGFLGQALFETYGERFGLTVTEWRVMASVGQSAGTSAAEISTKTRLDSVAVHRAVKSLAARRLIELRPAHGDRRRKPLALTAQGREIHDSVAPQALRLEQRMLQFLSAKEAAALRRALRKICEGLELL